MGFYTEPAFFALALIVAVPAVVLGCLGKSQRVYGLIASVLFLVLLFAGGAIEEAAAFCLFIVLSCVLQRFVQHLFASSNPHAVALYRVALALNIAPLFIYKLVAATGGTLFGFLGISYLTFKAVQVLIETRDGLIEHMRLLDYLYFLVFFPTFTSGPILRSRPFVEELENPPSREEYLDGLAMGVLRLLGGATYKFVFAALCSQLSWFLPQAIGYSDALHAVGSEVGVAFFYGLYLFFDFAGYSLMAMGLGAVFGCKVPRNFNMPFISVDIKEFWNRWHITLSFWLRDFVFMRFTQACMARSLFESRVTTACLGFIVNMTLMGLWHAFSPQCFVYGLYHGLLLAGCELFQRKSSFYKKHKNDRAYRIVSWAITMIAVFFSFSLFSGQVF